MTVIVCRIIVAVGKIPSVDIIDESVSIIINAIPCNFGGICPCNPLKVRVRKIEARIQNSNGYSRRSTKNVPKVRAADIGPNGPSPLADIILAPLLAEEWIVRNATAEPDTI